MRPRNKREFEVTRLSERLPMGCTGESRYYATRHAFDNDAYLCKGQVSCCGCGTTFDYDGSNVCPHCGRHLNIVKSRKMSERKRYYYSETLAFGGYQVVRTYMGERYWQRGKITDYDFTEVMQHWWNANAVLTLLAKPLGMCSYYYDTWRYCEPLSVKREVEKYAYQVRPSACMVFSVIPALRRNGLATSTHDAAPNRLIYELLTNPHFETLWKAKQYGIAADSELRWIELYWNTIKCAIRHHYTIKDVSMWQDYIEVARNLNMDILNPTIVCPADLKAEHDKAVETLRRRKEKAERERERLQAEQRALQAKNDNERFVKFKGRYFGITFGNDNIKVSVLDSIEAYAEEGKHMHHCVFACAYYKKAGSLILSAKDNEGNRLATIELSLCDWSVLQCRGVNNSVPKDYNTICQLVHQNVPLFQAAQRQKEALALAS